LKGIKKASLHLFGKVVFFWRFFSFSLVGYLKSSLQSLGVSASNGVNVLGVVDNDELGCLASVEQVLAVVSVNTVNFPNIKQKKKGIMSSLFSRRGQRCGITQKQ
jgi:hypothetical protein